MKKEHLITIIVLILIFSALPFIIYLAKYNGTFSIKNEDWGNFGSFIGGMTTALLSTLSLLSLIFTLHITIRNFQQQMENQHDNHIEQLQLQQDIHLEQKKLQERIHLEQLESQKEIHKKESNYTIFATNMSLLTLHIENLNKKLDVKNYNYFFSPMQTYLKFSEERFLESMKNDLEIKLSKSTAPHMRDVYNIISESRVTYPEEIIPLMSIIGIIMNTNDAKYKENYVSIFLTGIKQERTFWLICYAYESFPQMREKMNQLTTMMVVPEDIRAILKRHGALS